ncbi:MAG: hypothetical protein RLZZ116_2847, partial [Planctomycetota bacterium]
MSGDDDESFLAALHLLFFDEPEKARHAPSA